MEQKMKSGKVPESLMPALTHAISHQDRVLLNLIELALVRELKIRPEVAGDGDEWEPDGIAEIGRDLIIRWKERGTCGCSECGGSGELEAEGKTKTYYMECPECDGSGESQELSVGEGVEYTDIDGAEIQSIPEEAAFIEINGVDALSQFKRNLLRGAAA